MNKKVLMSAATTIMLLPNAVVFAEEAAPASPVEDVVEVVDSSAPVVLDTPVVEENLPEVKPEQEAEVSVTPVVPEKPVEPELSGTDNQSPVENVGQEVKQEEVDKDNTESEVVSPVSPSVTAGTSWNQNQDIAVTYAASSKSEEVHTRSKVDQVPEIKVQPSQASVKQDKIATELPSTGTESSSLGIVGTVLFSVMSFLGFTKARNKA